MNLRLFRSSHLLQAGGPSEKSCNIGKRIAAMAHLDHRPKPRSKSFFPSDAMSLQGARPELLSPVGPPPLSPAQRAIEQASFGHRKATSVVLPATDHALQRFAVQGKNADPHGHAALPSGPRHSHTTPEIRPGSRSLKSMPGHTLLLL